MIIRTNSIVDTGVALDHNKKWIKLIPILIIQLYLGFTVLLFLCGPWPYPINGIGVYIYLLLAQLTLLFGYLFGLRNKVNGVRLSLSVEKILLVSIIFSLLVLPPTTHYRTGKWLPDIIGALVDLGKAYSASLYYRSHNTPVIEYIRIILGPILYLSYPLLVFYWSQLGKYVKIFGLLSQLGIIALFIAMGTNQAIANMIFLFPWIIMGGHFSGVFVLNRERFIKVNAIFLLSVILFTMFFTGTQSTRNGSVAAHGFMTGVENSSVPTIASGAQVEKPSTAEGSGAQVEEPSPSKSIGIPANYENLLVKWLPEKAQVGVLGITYYVTQGYYALYLSQLEPFVPMYGSGNSTFLNRQIVRITGNTEIAKMPYPVRIEKHGWDSKEKWASIYPWIASDVGFPGTLIVIFLIGLAFAKSWLDTLEGNLLGVSIFSQFIIMLFYFSANNQLMQSGEGFTTFWLTLVLWIVLRRRHSIRGTNGDVTAKY